MANVTERWADVDVVTGLPLPTVMNHLETIAEKMQRGTCAQVTVFVLLPDSVATQNNFLKFQVVTMVGKEKTVAYRQH